MTDVDELVHTVMQAARQDSGDPRFIAFGHVTSYDPKRHAVRVSLPAYQVIDPTTGQAGGVPLLSPWMQLGTPWAGQGWGFQGAPAVGNAAPPNTGTQCAVFLVSRDSHMSLVACCFYTDVDTAPDPTLQAGEAVMKHASGTLMKFQANGNLQIVANPTLTIATEPGIGVTFDSSGNIAITLPNGKTFSVNGTSDALALVSKLIAAFNSHTHSGVQTGGGTSGTPSSTWTASTVQSAVAKVGG